MKNRNFLSSDLRVVFTNFLSLLVLKGGNYIFPLIYLPYLIKTVGVSSFGLISFAEAFMLYFKSVVDYGFDLTATRDIANNRADIYYLRRKMTIVLAVKCFLLILLAIGLFFLVNYSPLFSGNKILYFFSFLSVVGYALLPTWFFQGVEKMKVVTVLFFVARLISTCSLFVFVQDRSDYILVPLINGVGFIVSGAIGLGLMYRTGIKLVKVSVGDCFGEIRDGFPVFVSTFAPNLYNNSMTFLLGVFGTSIQVGLYSAGVKLVDIANSFVGVLSSAFFPFFSRNLLSHSKFRNLFLFPTFILSVAMFFLAPFLVESLFDLSENGRQTVLVLRITALSPFFLSCMSYYGTNFLIVLKKDKIMRDVTFVFSLFGFILAYFVIPEYKEVGAAFVLLLIRFLLALVIYLMYKKYSIQKFKS